MIHRQEGITKFIPLLAFIFVFQISRGMTLPIFPLYFHSINLSAISLGEALGVYGFSFLFFEALWGFLFEKFRLTSVNSDHHTGKYHCSPRFCKPLIFRRVVILELLLGMALGGVGVFPRIAIAKAAGNLERGRTFGMLGALYSIGATIGSLLGGVSDSCSWSFNNIYRGCSILDSFPSSLLLACIPFRKIGERIFRDTQCSRGFRTDHRTICKIKNQDNGDLWNWIYRASHGGEQWILQSAVAEYHGTEPANFSQCSRNQYCACNIHAFDRDHFAVHEHSRLAEALQMDHGRTDCDCGTLRCPKSTAQYSTN